MAVVVGFGGMSVMLEGDDVTRENFWHLLVEAMQQPNPLWFVLPSGRRFRLAEVTATDPDATTEVDEAYVNTYLRDGVTTLPFELVSNPEVGPVGISPSGRRLISVAFEAPDHPIVYRQRGNEAVFRL